MHEADSNIITSASRVVERCLAERRGTSHVMASMPELRPASGDELAQIVRLATRVIGAQRRLQFALGNDRSRLSSGRSRDLVVASLVEAGHSRPPDLDYLPSAEEMQNRLQAIADPKERFAVSHSIPDWLVAPLREAFGDDVDAVLQALGQAAPRTLRVNTLRSGSREQLLDRLAEEGIDAVPGRYASTAVHVTGHADLFQTEAFLDGCFEQQDEASQLAILATAPPPGGKVLDLCCGSGGKTLGLASMLSNRGVILASDIHEARIRDLQKRLPRTGAHNVQPLHVDGSKRAEQTLTQFARHADRILIDAPCTGTGSWRRRPQARWNIDAAGFAAMQQTQQELLLRAADWLRPGARLVYATCSLLPAENERQVEWLCQQRPELEQVRLVEILGGTVARPICDGSGTWLSVRPDQHGCDGFFVAVLRRRRS